MDTIQRGEELQRRVRSMEGLPAMPGSLDRIYRALQNPASPARELADAISSDLGITARVLRMANSSYYALNRPVSDVREATVVLGYEVVKSIALGATVVDAFRGKVPSFDMQSFWKHSVETAVAADCLARATRGVLPEVAFCAGILHDVGKLALVAILREKAAALLQDPSHEFSQEAVELGADHATAGMWLGLHWKFSPELLDAIAYHHFPAQAGESRRLAGIIALAESTLEALETPGPGAEPRTWDPALADLVGIDRSELEVVMARLPERLLAAAPMIGF